MPTNFLSFDTPTTPAQIDRRKAMASALKVKQPVKHPLQAIDNAVGDITGAFLDRQVAQGEDARRKALADALQGIAPGGLDPKVYGALIENDPESAMKIVAQSQMGAADRSNEMADWQAKQRWTLDNPAPEKPTSDIQNFEYGQQHPEFAAAGGAFAGTSVEAQSLNKLIAAGTITEAQAAEIGAGKTVTDPNTGAVIFLSPSGIAAQMPGEAPQLLTPDAGAPPPDAGPAAPAPIAQPLPKIGGPDEPMPAGEQPPVVSPDGVAPAAPPAPAAAIPAPPPPAGAPIAPAAPAAANPGIIPITGPRKMDEAQSKAATFADVMTESGKILEEMGTKGSGMVDKVLGNVPYAGQYGTSEDYKKADQAKRAFINAQLRRESGAVISDQEFANADQQYFPQPNDPPQLLEQKRKNRETVIEGMKRSAGPAYQAPADASDIPSAIPGVTIRRKN